MKVRQHKAEVHSSKIYGAKHTELSVHSQNSTWVRQGIVTFTVKVSKGQ